MALSQRIASLPSQSLRLTANTFYPEDPTGIDAWKSYCRYFRELLPWEGRHILRRKDALLHFAAHGEIQDGALLWQQLCNRFPHIPLDKLDDSIRQSFIEADNESTQVWYTHSKGALELYVDPGEPTDVHDGNVLTAVRDACVRVIQDFIKQLAGASDIAESLTYGRVHVSALPPDCSLYANDFYAAPLLLQFPAPTTLSYKITRPQLLFGDVLLNPIMEQAYLMEPASFTQEIRVHVTCCHQLVREKSIAPPQCHTTNYVQPTRAIVPYGIFRIGQQKDDFQSFTLPRAILMAFARFEISLRVAVTSQELPTLFLSFLSTQFIVLVSDIQRLLPNQGEAEKLLRGLLGADDQVVCEAYLEWMVCERALELKSQNDIATHRLFLEVYLYTQLWMALYNTWSRLRQNDRLHTGNSLHHLQNTLFWLRCSTISTTLVTTCVDRGLLFEGNEGDPLHAQVNAFNNELQKKRQSHGNLREEPPAFAGTLWLWKLILESSNKIPSYDV